MQDDYKPVVPKWVGDILQKKKNNPNDGTATMGYSKEWDEWKSKYSRKLKYAKLNGWTVEDSK